MHWKGNDESGPAPQLAVGGDCAPVPVRDPPANRQPDARSFIFIAPMQSLKDRKYLFQKFFFEADPIVFDTQFAKLLSSDTMKYAGMDFNNRNRTFRLKLQRIRD